MRSAIFGAPLSSAAATMSQYHLRSPVPVSQAESCLSHVQSACHYQSAVSLARERDDKQTYHFSQQQHEQIVSKHQCRLTDDSFAQRCLLHPEADHATEIVAVASFTNLQEMSMACTSLAEMSTTVYHLEANTGEMTRHCGCENGPTVLCSWELFRSSTVSYTAQYHPPRSVFVSEVDFSFSYGC